MSNVQGNISFRVSEEQQDQIVRAAAAARQSVSDYCREILVPFAASDLKEPVAEAPAPKRAPSPVSIAAAARGMTRDQYRQFAAEALAQADLRPGSGMRPAVRPVKRPSTRPGSYSLNDIAAQSVAPAHRSSR